VLDLFTNKVIQRSIISTCHGQDSAGIYTEKIRYAKKKKKKTNLILVYLNNVIMQGLTPSFVSPLICQVEAC
jgi:hypothetical protein